MRVTFVGKLDVNEMLSKLNEIAESTINRMIAESADEVSISGFEIHDAEFTVKFNVEGMEDAQVMTVEHHEGYPEMFKWIVNADTDETTSNEEESEFDAYTVAKVKTGKEPEFKEIESIYNIMDIDEISDLSEVYSNMSKKVYEHKDGFKVVQVRQNRRLVQEYKLIPQKEEQA